MRLDEGLAANLKLEPKQAQALAGGLLLFLEDLLKRHERGELATAIRRSTPELSEWQTLAPTLPVGALTVDAIAANVGSEAGQFNLLLMSFSVAPASHGTVKKLLVGFLAERLGSAAIEQLRAATEFLAD
jgi:hypothetical protein